MIDADPALFSIPITPRLEATGASFQKGSFMKRFFVHGALLSAVLLSGCATDRGERRAATRGALIGAAGGAAISAVTGGDALQGAAIGAAGGAVVGAITHDGRRRDVYRDNRGRKYWTDDRGRRHRVR